MIADSFHIANGDATGEVLKEAGLAGEIITFREALVDGPVRPLDRAGFIELRARFLSRESSDSIDQVREALVAQEDAIDRARSGRSVVIWVEHDLFCSVTLWYLLSRLAEADGLQVDLVSIGTFPGRDEFEGLGELTPPDLASLFPQRRRVAPAGRETGQALWDAYSSDDPERLLQLRDKCDAVPFAAESILLHARRFPSRNDGLGAIESEAVKLLVSDGPKSFPPLFQSLRRLVRPFGFGDRQIIGLLRMLAADEQPLVRIDEIEGEATFSATPQSVPVVRGLARAPRSIYHDRWLGGLRLDQSSLLYWNEERQTLERS